MSARDQLSESVRARVDALQARVIAAGILDLRFTKDHTTWNALSYDERAGQICDVLEAYLDGKCRPLSMEELDEILC